jgi:hypothetical protein
MRTLKRRERRSGRVQDKFVKNPIFPLFFVEI